MGPTRDNGKSLGRARPGKMSRGTDRPAANSVWIYLGCVTMNLFHCRGWQCWRMWQTYLMVVGFSGYHRICSNVRMVSIGIEPLKRKEAKWVSHSRNSLWAFDSFTSGFSKSWVITKQDVWGLLHFTEKYRVQQNLGYNFAWPYFAKFRSSGRIEGCRRYAAW